MMGRGLETREVIARLLAALGSRREVEQYLRHYASVDSQKFAILKVGGSVLEKSLESLASSLAFLRPVGLFPIVLHGGRPQIARALAEAGLPDDELDGHRITPRGSSRWCGGCACARTCASSRPSRSSVLRRGR